MMTSRQNTSQDIILIVDESGSMGSMGNEPVQTINKFITDQQKVLDSGTSTFSLWKFNTTVTQVIDDQPLRGVTEFSDYHPSGMTALLDAIGMAISTKLKKPKHVDVICVILTDGQENSSHEYTRKQIKDLTTEMETKHNWKFVYLGANQDSFAVGNTYGVNAARCLNFETSSGGLVRQIDTVSASIGSYRRNVAKGIPNADLIITDQPTMPAQLNRQDRIKTTTSAPSTFPQSLSRGRWL